MFELMNRYSEYLYENLIIEHSKKPLKGMDVEDFLMGCIRLVFKSVMLLTVPSMLLTTIN